MFKDAFPMCVCIHAHVHVTWRPSPQARTHLLRLSPDLFGRIGQPRGQACILAAARHSRIRLRQVVILQQGGARGGRANLAACGTPTAAASSRITLRVQRQHAACVVSYVQRLHRITQPASGPRAPCRRSGSRAGTEGQVQKTTSTAVPGSPVT